VAGDAALLVAPADIDGLAGAMETVITDPAAAARLVAAGEARLGHFSWSDTAARLAQLYHRLAAGGTT
jgi:glycogen(starch) synthase